MEKAMTFPRKDSGTVRIVGSYVVRDERGLEHIHKIKVFTGPRKALRT